MSVPYNINSVSNVEKLSEKLRMTTPFIAFMNLLGIEKDNMSSKLRNILDELHEYIADTGFTLVVLDSVSPPVLKKKGKTRLKEQEHG